MITKETVTKKYCCFYVSDYHLEMILVPYIKNHLDKCKIDIYTQEDLTKSICNVIDRINLTQNDKNKILNLNWKKEKIEDIENEKIGSNENRIIIINGNSDYIEKVNKLFEEIKTQSIIHCYKIEDTNIKINEIVRNYDEILNTKNI